MWRMLDLNDHRIACHRETEVKAAMPGEHKRISLSLRLQVMVWLGSQSEVKQHLVSLNTAQKMAVKNVGNAFE